MLGRLAKSSLRSFTTHHAWTPSRYSFPSAHAFEVTPETTELFVRRVIKCIRERLVTYDPERWRGVEITYNSHWNHGGYVDIPTCIQVHEALEKEFKVEILDQRILVTDVSTACALVAGIEHLR
ncbi:unnamed protein product [Blepharisma stoltei]|uniref:Carrier domain-containing protein n=1 Tax=Blepharisma stoltei TaxID=1481888 RepID=A0AAU9K0W9_9CILI|nr:unnamed protein product [Blepharisma stoltei]